MTTEELKKKIQSWLEGNLDVWTNAKDMKKYIQRSQMSTEQIAEDLANFLSEEK